jgi:hypothetical protein
MSLDSVYKYRLFCDNEECLGVTLARVTECVCPKCGSKMRLGAFSRPAPADTKEGEQLRTTGQS